MLGDAPEFAGNQHWFNTPGDRPLTLRPARPGRPGRLLDLQLHQLHPHPALPEGLGRALPQGRADDRRRPHARVPVRARSGQRRRRRSSENGIRYPGRPGQRPGDLERLRQPVLAGRVLHRRPGPGPLRPLRRGRIRRERAGDPRAAGRSRAGSPGEETGVHGDRTLGDGDDARRPTSAPPAPNASPTRCSRPACHDFTAPASLPANEFAYHGRWRIALDSATAGRRPRSTSTSAPAASTSCSARRARAAR